MALLKISWHQCIKAHSPLYETTSHTTSCRLWSGSKTKWFSPSSSFSSSSSCAPSSRPAALFCLHRAREGRPRPRPRPHRMAVENWGKGGGEQRGQAAPRPISSRGGSRRGERPRGRSVRSSGAAPCSPRTALQCPHPTQRRDPPITQLPPTLSPLTLPPLTPTISHFQRFGTAHPSPTPLIISHPKGFASG